MTAPVTEPASNAEVSRQSSAGCASPEYIANLKLELFKLHADKLIDGRTRAFQDIDKAILTLSTALLAFSISFTKDFVRADPVVPILLCCAWICWAGSVVTTLLSFRASIPALDQRLREAEKLYLPEFEPATPTAQANNSLAAADDGVWGRLVTWRKTPANPATLTYAFNLGSLATFLAGIAFFVLFAVANVLWGKSMTDDKVQKVPIAEGYVPHALTKIPRYSEHGGVEPQALTPVAAAHTSAPGRGTAAPTQKGLVPQALTPVPVLPSGTASGPTPSAGSASPPPPKPADPNAKHK